MLTNWSFLYFSKPANSDIWVIVEPGGGFQGSNPIIEGLILKLETLSLIVG